MLSQRVFVQIKGLREDGHASGEVSAALGIPLTVVNRAYLLPTYDDFKKYGATIDTLVGRENVHEEDRTKKCHTCKRVLQVDCFYRNKAQPDGLATNCKDCDKEFKQNTLKQNSEPNDYAVSRQKQNAARAVKRALARGLIFKTPCVVCGSPKVCIYRTYGLDDEDHWLEVEWLCFKHLLEKEQAETCYTQNIG